MTNETLAPATRQAIAIKDRSQALTVTGKLKTAIDIMIWQGLPRRDAAASAGLKDHSLQVALRKPHVLAYFNAEMTSLRTSLRPRTIHRLDGIADNSRNDQAKVAALRTLEAISDRDDGTSRPSSATPGVTIIINNAPPAKVVEGPLIEAYGSEAGVFTP